MGEVVAGTGETVGVMGVVKRCKRSVRARSVASPTVAKGEAGDGLDSASVRVLTTRVATSTKEGAVMTHWCGENCTVLAMRPAQVFGK